MEIFKNGIAVAINPQTFHIFIHIQYSVGQTYQLITLIHQAKSETIFFPHFNSYNQYTMSVSCVLFVLCNIGIEKLISIKAERELFFCFWSFSHSFCEIYLFGEMYERITEPNKYVYQQKIRMKFDANTKN